MKPLDMMFRDLKFFSPKLIPYGTLRIKGLCQPLTDYLSIFPRFDFKTSN